MITKLINPEIGSYRAINTDHDVSGPGLDVTIVQRAEESGDRIWVLDGIQYSYSPDRTTGGLVVKVGDNVKIDVDINDLGNSMNLYIPSQTDKDISVTLKGGGNGVIGKLNTQWHVEPA